MASSSATSVLVRIQNRRGGGMSLGIFAHCAFAVAFALALAFLLALGAVQPAHADGPTTGTWGSSHWEIDGDRLIVVGDDGGHRAGSVATAPWNPSNPDHADMTKVKKIVIGTAQVPVTFEYGSAENLFANLSGIETIDLTHFDTSVNVYDGVVLEGATSMASMFSNCDNLTTLKLGNDFDTSRVTDMANMFSGCSKLATLDVSKFDTSRVTNMSNMFSGCSKLATLNVSKFDTSRVTNMSGMFSGCEALSTLDVSSFDTSLVESMGEMFSGCKALTSLNVTGFDTSRVTSMELMFAECSRLGALDVTGFNTSGVTTMNSMFRNCGALSTLDVSSFDTALVTDMGYMFNGCSSLTFLDLSNFAPSKMSNMESMFKDCAGLVSLNLSGFATSSQTKMSNLFFDCTSLSAVRLGKEFGFNDSSSHLPVNVTNAAGMGYRPSMQWIDPKGEAHTPDELNPSEQGAGWYLVQPFYPNTYAFFDWGVRGTPPTFVMVTNSSASDPGQMDGRTPKGWVDAAGNPVTFPVTVTKGSAVALSATWDKQPFSIDDYTWSCPTDTTYDGKTHQATVKPKNAFVGAVTNLRYVNSDGSASASSPKDAGTYEVLFDVVGNASYVGTNDVSLGSFTISKIKLEESLDTLRVPLADIYKGTMKTENMSITITGGNIVPAEDPLSAIATVTYPNGNDASGLGEHYDAKVTDIQLENPNYEPPAEISGQTYTVKEKKYTELKHFTISLPGDAPGHVVEYNGELQPAVIKPKTGIEGMGDVTVKYSKNGGTATTKVPKDAGVYKVSFDVAEGVAYMEKSFDNVGTFTIKPRVLNAGIRANVPSVVVGSPKGSYANMPITLENENGGNILASDEPLKATATVTYGVTNVVATGVEEATVTDVVLTAVEDSNVHENYKVPDSYKLEYQAYEVTRKTPTADDFNFTPPTSLVYDGTEHKATVAPKTDIAGMGVVTEYYTRTDGEPSAPTTTPPKDAGTYQVTFAVTEGTNYKATTENLVDDTFTFTIAKRVLNKSEIAKLPPVVVGSTTDPVDGVSIELSGGAIVSGESLTATATVTHPKTDTVTTYTNATVTNVELKSVSANYKVPENYQLTGQSYAVTPKPVPTIADFTVTAAEAEYDGQAHAAGITPKTVGVGEYENVRYFKGNESTPVNPVDVGTYTLKFDVKETATHAAATDLVVTDVVKINPRVLDANMAAKLDPIDQDTFAAQQVDVKLTGGRIVGGAELSAIASEVSYLTAGAAGGHTDATVVLVSLENAPNYLLPAGGLTLTSQSYTVNPRPANYNITEGENGSWQQGSAEGLRFVADVELPKLKNVSLNGALVDSTNYTAESGSTIVTLKPAYLATLATGSHTLRLAFTDGAAETTFTIAAAPKPGVDPGKDPGANSGGDSGSDGSALAPTGDSAAPLALAVAALAAFAGTSLVVARRTRR